MDRRFSGVAGGRPRLKAAIETRELITVSVNGVRLRGTYHKPQDSGADESRVGLFFFNPGFLPRAGTGDSAVDFAGSCARRGYPTFRFDLPGLGDADGEPPLNLLDYINAGKYAPVLAATFKELKKRYNLPGIVVIGHCAGAVSALYTAVSSKECCGMVMLDPYFFLPKARPKLRHELSAWAGSSWLGGRLSKVFDLLKLMRRTLAGRKLPSNANVPLLSCWKQVAGSGMPILILKAPAPKSSGLKPTPGEFDYCAYLLTLIGRGSRVVLDLIEGSNLSFADLKGRAAVQQKTQMWLNTYFPPIEQSAVFEATGNSADEVVEVPRNQKLRQEPQPYMHG